MKTRSWIRKLFSSSARPVTRRAPHRLRVEALEERAVPASITVNSTADILNPAPGVVTLRSAIEQANANPRADTINLALAGTYKITLAGALEDNNATGDFDILATGGDLNIVNTSGGTVIVDGNHLDRVFDVNPANTSDPATKITVTMQGFTIQNGVALDAANPDAPSSSGGGIRDQGNASLTLTNLIVTNNMASADGGGVVMENAPGSTPWTLTVNNSTISNNHAGDAGGGIDIDGKGKTFINSGTVISGNSAVNQGAGIWLDAIAGAVDSVAITSGGAGYTSAPIVTFTSADGNGTGAAGFATIQNGQVVSVTLTNSGSGYDAAPTVGFSGGNPATAGTATATFAAFQTATLNVTGALIANNQALMGQGGGIGNAGNGAVTITNSTLENNFSGVTGGGFGDENNVGTLTVSNSLFLNNFSAGMGGAIQEGGPSTNITSSEFKSNVSGSVGGGLFLDGVTATILSSTIADNTSSNDGGGLDIETSGTGATGSTLTNSTVVGNRR